ncbi:MAG: HYR domain-containing protein [Bacteroidetes bacterium]|nr:HYR domain-containing protein [Bacteroidota bacterium]
MINNRKKVYRIRFTILFFMVFSTALWSQGLVAYYPFDNSTADFSGFNNDGKFYGGVKATSDRFGNPCGALHFDGKSGYIEVPSSNSLKTPIKNITVTCWFKLDSTYFTKGNRWLTLICKGNTFEETYKNPQYRVQFYQSSLQSTVSINTDFTEYDTNYVQNKFSFGQWYFYALVYDGKMVSAFLNDRKIWTFKYEKTFSANDAPMNIGKDIPGDLEYFCGALDDLRIYNTAFTETEILARFKEDSYAVLNDTVAFACAENIEVGNDPGECYAKVNFNKATVDYNCGNLGIKQISGLPSGSKFPMGVSSIVYEAKSKNGVTKTCKTNITVTDHEPPVINCKQDTFLINDDPNKKGVVYTYTMPIVKDNCSHSQIIMQDGLISGSLFPEGKTVLKFIATDEANNISECSYTVYVVNSINKLIYDASFCPPDIIKESTPIRCGTIVNYSFPNKKDNDAFKLIEGIASGNFFPCGTTRNRFQKTLPSNLVQECSFLVTVKESELPVLSCPNDTVIYCTNSETSVLYTYETPEAYDNCGIDSLQLIQGLSSGSVFPLGTTTIRYRATDRSGNAAECSFRVTVSSLNKISTDTHEKTPTKTYLPDKVSYTPDLKFNRCELTLLLYDDGQEDNDTVSVFFNGEEIVKREMIKLKQHGTINRTVSLLPGERNDFIVKAWNNGSISPNTIKIEFYEGSYNAYLVKLGTRKPKKVRVLHSKPGIAGAISIRCNN